MKSEAPTNSAGSKSVLRHFLKSWAHGRWHLHPEYNASHFPRWFILQYTLFFIYVRII